MTWKRARSPEQKEERRRAILAAAAALYESRGLEGAGLNAIARRACLSKANIYRYFESREEIFLHLTLEEYRAWIGEIEQALAPLAGRDDECALAATLAASLAARPRLCGLSASISVVLETNVSVEVVVWFKTRLLELMLRLSNAIRVAMPALDGDGTQHFLRLAHLLVTGLWPAAQPPPAVREALRRPELQYARVDFERDLRESLVVVLRGLMG